MGENTVTIGENTVHNALVDVKNLIFLFVKRVKVKKLSFLSVSTFGPPSGKHLRSWLSFSQKGRCHVLGLNYVCSVPSQTKTHQESIGFS